MTSMTAHRRRLVLTIGAASLVLGVTTTALLAATGFDRPGRWFNVPSCETPALTGTVIDATLTDMGAVMGPRANGPYGPGGPGNRYPGARGYGWPGMGMMRLTLDPATVSAGAVSFRAINTGALVHEVTVLPLASGQYPGQRAVGADDEVDESAALGHAARTCGEGDGNGIAPRAAGWTTISLPPGRYEVICNVPGHYLARMYAELNVTGTG